MITITGICVLLTLAFLLLQNRTTISNLVLNPFFWVCLAYIRFFSFADISESIALRADLANLLGFTIFSVSYYLSKRIARKDVLKKIALTISAPNNLNTHSKKIIDFYLSRTVIFILIILTGLWAFLEIYINILAFGGLNASLVRFYVGIPIQESSSLLFRITNFLFIVPLWTLVAFRIHSETTNQKFFKLFFWFVFFLVTLLMIPKGTVGYVLFPALILLFVDAVLIKKKLLIAYSYKTYFVLFVSLFIIGVFLLSVRGEYYEGPAGVLNRLYMLKTEELKENFLKAHSNVFDNVVVAFNNYGRSDDLPYFYSLYALLVNPIPREIWPEKPYGFGRILALSAGASEESGVSFAAGIAGEGYANGGWLGILLIAAFVGTLCGFFAKFCIVLIEMPSTIHALLSFQAWYAAQHFVRGDLLSAWAQSVYPFVITIILVYLAKIVVLVLRCKWL